MLVVLLIYYHYPKVLPFRNTIFLFMPSIYSIYQFPVRPQLTISITCEDHM